MTEAHWQFLRSSVGGVGGGGGGPYAFEVGTSENLFTQEGEGELAPPHKNACVMAGAAGRRNALHNPNTVGAQPGLMWQPFLIYFSSLCPPSLALSVARRIPGKKTRKVKITFLFMAGCPNVDEM